MKINALITALLLSVVSGCHEEKLKSFERIDAPTLKILATGSSAILGRGSGGPSPLNCDSRVKVWNNTNELGDNGWAFISPPDFGNPPWDAGGGNNPALWFADRAAKELRQEIRLVVVSKGGEPIASWNSPDGLLYQEVNEVYSASGLDPADVLLWMQGSGDESAGTTKSVYKAAFLALISDLQNAGILSEDATVIIGDPSVFAPTIDTYVQELVAENSFIKYADADGLETFDGVHYTGPSLFVLGYYRFWDQYP